MKIGEILNPLKVGKREFDPKELFNNLKSNTIVWCWGAQAWTVYKDKFLRFKSNGYLHKGHVYITLGWNDTFTIIYTTLKGKILDIQTDIYIDMLIDSIDRKVETK